MRDQKDETPVVKVVATGFSVVFGVADDCQITFQSGFEGDEDDSVVNARIDRLMRFGERQQALRRIPKLEKDLADQKGKLAQFQADRAEIELQADTKIAQLEIELRQREEQREPEKKAFEADINGKILAMQERKAEAFNAGHAEHVKAGRTGDYTPRGDRKVQIDRIDRAIKEATDLRGKAIADFEITYQSGIDTAKLEIEKARNEKEQALRASQISIDRFTEAVANTEALLHQAREMKGT